MCPGRHGFPRLVFAVLVLFGAATAYANPPRDSHYCFFKEKRPLPIDVNRVALMPLSDAPASLDELHARLALAGVDPATPTAMTIAPWLEFSLRVNQRNEQGVDGAVKSVAANHLADFVSPVFIGLDDGPLVVTPEILVGFAAGVDAAEAEAILRDAGAGQILDRDWGGMKGAYRLRHSSRDGFEVLMAANRLAQLSEVLFAEPDMMFTGRGDLIPNDPAFNVLWGIHNTGQFGGFADMDMDGPEAWDITTGDPSIIVVIIDVGVQPDHPDLNLLTPGFDATGQAGAGAPVNACDNHGTPVAGCVSTTINNNVGSVGIAPGCRSASARTFISTVPCDGTWSSNASWTVNTLTWAESIGARVSNNSNYYGFQSGAIANKYQTTQTNGMVHFASAGNDSSSAITYPASLPSVNAIAALDPDGTLTYFSNWGFGLAFSAPGIDVYVPDRTGPAGYNTGDYAYVLGTSFASPYSAGVAALVLSVDPSLTAAEVESLMAQTSVDLGAAGYDATFGWGFVNAFDAVSTASLTPPMPLLPGGDVCVDGSNDGGPCSQHADCPSGACEVKNRFLSVAVPSARAAGVPPPETAIQVTAVSLPGSLSTYNGDVWWAGAPSDIPESNVIGTPLFRGAALECTTTPYVQLWETEGTVHLYGAIVVPGATYEVRLCYSTVGPCSTPLTINTAKWGDVIRPLVTLQPNFIDVATLVDKFRDLSGALSKTRTQLQPNDLNVFANVNFLDISACVGAILGLSYPYPAAPCP